MKPPSLVQLLAELKEEITERTVTVQKESCLKIINEDDDSEIEVTGPEAGLLLNSVATAEQFIDALDAPGDCYLELHDLRVDADVMSLLERKFLALDEI